ncbi:MAG: DAK2 domain-containing protein, partial [Chloroflexota bacterium]
MTLRTCDGRLLLRAAAGATAILVRHAAEVDALNVFPVPDGDTGRNMLATMRAAADAAAALPAGSRSAEAVGGALARGALLGARGNSGVILSQVFRGLAEGAAGRRRVDGNDLARGLRAASVHADAAVDRPVEGTILSVVRAAADAAEAAAHRDPSVEAVLADAAAAAATAVLRTPEQLAVLREAGVVDAGGRGFELLLRGALAALAEDPGPAVPVGPVGAAGLPHAATVAGEEAGSAYGFETAYLVLAPPGGRLDAAALRAELAPLGDSLLVVGDTELLRVHIHGDRPDLALAAGLRAGRVRRVTVENLDALAAGDREERVGELLGLTEGELPGHALP